MNRLKNLGINVKIARLKSGLSQEQLAEKIDVSRMTISMIETAKQNPTILKVIDISKALNVNIETLIKDV